MSDLSALENARNSAAGYGPTKQVLIVDDEPSIRKLLRTLLTRWGYRTLVAQDGKQALEIAAEHPGDIDLLLSDVSMPVMDGQELAETLTKKRPAIKVILMSGYSHFQVVLRLGWHFLQKPFTSSELKDRIKKII